MRRSGSERGTGERDEKGKGTCLFRILIVAKKRFGSVSLQKIFGRNTLRFHKEREREREKGRERERKSARPNTTRPRKNLCFLISVSLSNFYLLHQLHHRMKEGEASYGKGVSTHVCEVEITGGG